MEDNFLATIKDKALSIEAVRQLIERDFDTVAMPRSAYTLDRLVVKVHEHPTQQWIQAVIELRVKYYEIRKTLLHIKRAQRDFDAATDEIERELKELEIEQLQWYIRCCWNEFEALLTIYQAMPGYTRDEIEAAQPEYWHNRLTKQANFDLASTGRIGQGNLEALRQAGIVKVHDGGQVEIIKNAAGN